jgi:hypothetical protein
VAALLVAHQAQHLVEIGTASAELAAKVATIAEVLTVTIAEHVFVRVLQLVADIVLLLQASEFQA